MSKKQLKVIITRKLPAITETRLMELFDCQLNLDDHQMDAQELTAAVQNCDVLVPTVTDKVTREIIAAAGDNFRMIACFSAGVDNIDWHAARERGIIVTNTPDALSEDTADMTMALILALARRLSEGERLIRSGNWQGWRPIGMLGTRIWGKRLGIIGMGRIGTALARRARGFGLSIHYHNRRQLPADAEAALEATYWSSLDQLLSHMDIISINCPHTPATYHLLNGRRLGCIKPHAFIVNTSRGEVIDEQALVKALKTKTIAGAGLDVFERAPHFNPALLRQENVVLLPHMGSATEEGRVEMGEKVIINIRAFYDDHTPPNRVVESLF